MPRTNRQATSLRLLRGIAAAAIAASLVACANVSYDRDEAIRIPAGATVAFAGGRWEGREDLDPAVGNDIVHRRIQAAILAQLRSKGFEVVEKEAGADFLVRYFVAIRRETRQIATTSGPPPSPFKTRGWGWGWGGGTVTTLTPLDFSEVSLVVDLVERSSGHTAWRAVWRGDPGARAPSQEEIDSKMERIFRSAPSPG